MKVLVTGGSGFLGSHIIEQLREQGHQARSMARSPQPELEARGVETIKGDICSEQDAARAVKGCDAVIHTAAMVGAWGKEDQFFKVNVEGTRVMLKAAREAGIERFVFTSSPSVVFDGTPLINAGPETPYPTSFPTPYASTKAESERVALAADDPAGMRVTALRPQLMWGPGDPHLLPMLMKKAEAGKLRVVGDGKARVDITYIDNAARAHLDALDALGKPVGEDHPGGKAYFISNGEPVELWSWISALMKQMGAPAPGGAVPRQAAWLAGWATEVFWSLLGKQEDPPLTRYVALKMSTDQYYDLEPARRDLGYVPSISMEEGLQRLLEDRATTSG